MKKIILSVLSITCLASILFAQDIHTPAEIMKIMDKSKITYEIHVLDKKVDAPDRSNNLNYNIYYRKKVDKGLGFYEYELSDTLRTLLKKAEDDFQNRQYEDARNMYLKILKTDSNYFQVMTYIGQTYGIEKNWEKAIEWYQNTIQKNYIDYMAHWFLADAYKETGQLDKALDEILTAHILNRNNPRIKKALFEIYDSKDLLFDDWQFTPQCKIDSISKKKIQIETEVNWIPYAITKAIWMYEPGYKKSMGMEKQSYSTTEELESLMGLYALVTRDEEIVQNHPEFKGLKLAVDNKLLNEYIMYEIFLPQYPYVAYQMDEKFIQEIKEYIQLAH